MSFEHTRVRALCEDDPDDRGTYVLSWMQQSQRSPHNPALEHAVRLANNLTQPMLVGFGVYERYPDASERAFAFLLEGLAETAAALADRGINLVLRRGRPDVVALGLAKDASIVVCHRGYRLSVGCERIVEGGGGFFVDAAYVFGRELEYKITPLARSLDDAIMIRV